MKKAWVVTLSIMLVVMLSCVATDASGVFLNDSGDAARAIRIAFSEPVEITGFGDRFDYQSPKGKATTFVFTGTPLNDSWTFWVSWSPASASVVKREWLRTGGRVQLDINIGSNPATLDPSRIDSGDTASLWVIEQLFLGLVDYDENGKVVPELATSWEASPDATVWTFTLRNDVTWSDGVPVTAEDVRCGFLRALDPEHPYPYPYVFDVIHGAKTYYTGEASNSDGVGVEVLDEHHIRFTLDQPASYFPALAVIRPFWAVPKHLLDVVGDAWTDPENIVTDGPYQLVGWAHGDHITLEKSEAHYAAQDVQIKRVVMWMVDEETAWEKYLEGLLDTLRVPVNRLQDAKNHQVLAAELHMQSNAGTEFYGFNVKLPPFNNVSVRKAFIAAADRSSLIEAVEIHLLSDPLPEVALTLTPPGIFGHIDGTKEEVGVSYDPEQAKRWLGEAGYPNGQELSKITVWFNTRSDLDSYHRVPAEDMRRNWLASLGVSVGLEGVSWSIYRDELLPQAKCQVFRLGWVAHYPDARDFLSSLFRYLGSTLQAALGGWSNQKFDSLLDEASRELDPEIRRDLYKQAEKILVETDAVIMPLFYSGSAIATKPYLQRTFPSFGAPNIAKWRLLPEDDRLP